MAKRLPTPTIKPPLQALGECHGSDKLPHLGFPHLGPRLPAGRAHAGSSAGNLRFDRWRSHRRLRRGGAGRGGDADEHGHIRAPECRERRKRQLPVCEPHSWPLPVDRRIGWFQAVAARRNRRGGPGGGAYRRASGSRRGQPSHRGGGADAAPSDPGEFVESGGGGPDGSGDAAQRTKRAEPDSPGSRRGTSRLSHGEHGWSERLCLGELPDWRRCSQPECHLP